MKDIH